MKLIIDESDLNRLNCIGLSVNRDATYEYRTYLFDNREKRQGLDEFTSASNSIRKRVTYRIRPQRKPNYEQCVQSFKERMQIDIKTDYLLPALTLPNAPVCFRLMQLGAKYNNDTLDCFKVYFSLRSFRDDMDALGEFQEWDKVKEVLLPLAYKCGVQSAGLDRISAVSYDLQKQAFLPALVGVNCYDQKVEYKLYYEQISSGSVFEKQPDIGITTINKICNTLSYSHEEATAFARDNWELGLFLKGIGLSSECEEIRFYFARKEQYL